MNSVPHLLTEDRPEFERVLDQALRTAGRDPGLAALADRSAADRLRTMALHDAAVIASAAADEYRAYVAARERLRSPAPGPVRTARPVRTDHPARTPALPGSAPAGVPAEPLNPEAEADGAAGAGLFAMLAVLAPVLAGVAAALFLAVGYALHVVHPTPSVARPMVTAGWLFAAFAAGAVLLDAVGIVLTALRNGAGAPWGGGHGERAREAAWARAAWRQALLERGIAPYLRAALDAPATAPASRTLVPPPVQVPKTSPSAPAAPALGDGHRPDGTGPGRMPHLGYSHPGYTSPDYTGAGPDDARPDARPDDRRHRPDAPGPS
ncbi:hypothetical protein RKE29_20800 [Streptomyces sp. B1866]|uniref:hypothetical protein n=1 Tax=Streptomyces sp. B1866 TaxID=3075431 RepID=UPI002891F0CB|nr:hypothetical protein [Streptomyces sp. B1866]MDT3399054.1 hypothetical protein [Streptomyces sp. B1866]